MQRNLEEHFQMALKSATEIGLHLDISRTTKVSDDAIHAARERCSNNINPGAFTQHACTHDAWQLSKA